MTFHFWPKKHSETPYFGASSLKNPQRASARLRFFPSGPQKSVISECFLFSKMKCQQTLESLYYLEIKKEIFVLSAEIYRSLRVRGITIRKTLDCIIAASAIQYQVPLLHNDRDFDPIEKYFDLWIM